MMKSLDLTAKEQALIVVAVSQFMGSMKQGLEADSVNYIAKSILDKMGKVDQTTLSSLGGNTYEELRTEVQSTDK
jgi:uncharacterized membrane protein YqgA involved in biofilm formation